MAGNSPSWPERPDLKVHLVSGYAEEATLRTGFLDSGVDMVTKPFALDVLGAKIRILIERQIES